MSWAPRRLRSFCTVFSLLTSIFWKQVVTGGECDSESHDFRLRLLQLIQARTFLSFFFVLVTGFAVIVVYRSRNKLVRLPWPRPRIACRHVTHLVPFIESSVYSHAPTNSLPYHFILPSNRISKHPEPIVRWLP